MNLCRYCSTPVADSEAVKTLAYWNQTVCICHAQCKTAGEKQEALDCQTIDSDCNDCKHYKRGTLAAKIVSKLHRQDGTIVDVIHQPNYFIGGLCLKFNRSVLAQPKKWSGLECFEHRRSL